LYRPDIVLVDLGLPDGRGEGLIAQLAAAKHRPPLVIATSGDDHARSDALAAGADLFLDKPLPDLTEFRGLLVDHYPAALPLALLPNRPFRPEADALALQDDLAMAEKRLTQADDLSYISGFVAGVAGSAGDQELHRAARSDQTDFRQLRDIIQDRLRNMEGSL
jgi:CheY-like chemotaxis protein